MSKKLSKIGSSKHPWLTANAKLGTSFFGNLKNPTIFKFQNVGRPEHLWSPLVTKHKNHVFFERREVGQAVWTVRTDVKGASRNNSDRLVFQYFLLAAEIYVFARSALYFRELVWTTTFRPSVRPFVRRQNNHRLSKDSGGVDMGKRAFYRVGFRALGILGFSSFKKNMPKSCISG